MSGTDEAETNKRNRTGSPRSTLDLTFVDFVNSDPRENLIVRQGGEFEIEFVNAAVSDELLDIIQAYTNEASRFRFWAVAIAGYSKSYDFAGKRWTAFSLGENRKAIQAYDVIQSPAIAHRDSSESTATATIDGTMLRGTEYLIDARIDSLQRMMEMSDVGVFDYRPDGTLIRANDSWYKYSGHPRNFGGAQEYSFMDLIHPDDAEMTIQQWNLLLQGIPVTFEFRWKAAPGAHGVSQNLFDGAQWVLCAGVPVLDEKGELISIAGNTIDISAQKRAERQALQRAETLEQLRASENRFARFAENTPVAIYYFDSSQKMQYCNDLFFEITGHPRMAFEDVSWALIIYPDDMPAAIEAWRCLLEDNKPTNIQFRINKEYVAPDGSRSQCVVNALTYCDLNPDGTVKDIAGTVADVSHFKWVENLQTIKADEAIEAKRQQENFIDMTSHEMRNPLSAVIQCADVAIDSVNELSNICERNMRTLETELQSAQAEVRSCMDALQTIISCSMHQKRIIDDILTLSKLDSSLLQITPVRVQSTAVLTEAVKMFDIECAKADIDLSFEVDATVYDYDAEWVMLDPSRLLQVLINLLTNAIKFTRARPVRRIQIKMSASSTKPTDHQTGVRFSTPSPRNCQSDPLEHKDWGSGKKLFLFFQVTDTGCGIEPDQQGTLFSRFQQASPRTHVQYGGSGLGLFISKSLTELQSGAIGIASKPEIGSTFAFFVGTRTTEPPIASPVLVPLHKVTSRARTLSSSSVTAQSRQSSSAANGRTTNTSSRLQSPSREAAVTVPTKPPTLEQRFKAANHSVLIVEDNIVNQKVLAQQLRKAGCTVHVAGHGVAALDFIRTTSHFNPIQQAIDHGGSMVDNPSETTITDVTTAVATSVTPEVPLDVILMDIEMPVMDGLTCTREIRRMEGEGELQGHIPILAVSANARSEQVTNAIDMGMDGAVTKPFRLVDIIPRIMALVDPVGIDPGVTTLPII